MTTALAAFLGRFLGEVLKHVLPVIFDEWRKSKRIELLGGDAALRDDVNASVDSMRERTNTDRQG